ncbi:hypothetical protein GTO27_05025 [Candidatus Bathyarchaeota archaeon]|nr:hypothetical protein [Candidatus Bathyarchaeota archaeon]
MSKRIVSEIFLVVVLVGMLELTLHTQPVKAITIIVPDDYPTIQQAVNNADDGDCISVRNGTYYEAQVTIEKALSLVGENKINTVAAQLDISCPVQVYLNDICVNRLHAENSTIVWATGCRFKEAYVSSNAKLLLSQSEAWKVHIYDEGEILGFYNLPLFGRVVFPLPFGFIFYILLVVLALGFATTSVAVYVLRRKREARKDLASTK